MTNPILVSGILSAVANPGFTRLFGKGSVNNFVELNQFDIIPGTGPFLPNQLADFPVAFESRFALSDYLPLPVVAPPKGPIHNRLKEIPVLPLHWDYRASDGSLLTPTKDAAGQVTGLSGKGKDGTEYSLSLQPSFAQGTGATPESKAAWVFANVSFTKGTDAPLLFGFGYCPFSGLFQVYLGSGNAQNIIRAQIPAIADKGTEATLTRLFTYYGDTYSTQIQPMPYRATDPGFYLPAVATLWPHLDAVEFFAPAIALIESQTVPLLPALPAGTTPLDVLASVSFVPPIAMGTFDASFPGLVGSALGPLAASFVAPTETEVAGLQSAASWLGFALALGSGNQDLAQLAAAFLKEINGSLGGGGSQSDGPPEWLDPFGFGDKQDARKAHA